MIRNLIGVMGPGETATAQEIETAYNLGRAIAQEGWVLLTGGRAVGVMDAASRGAQSAEGWVVGVLPGETTTGMSLAVDIPILTGMGSGRNVINVLSSQVVIACGLGAGTLSEVALALKLHKPLIIMHIAPVVVSRWQNLANRPIQSVETVDEAIAQVQQYLTSP